MPVPIRRQVPRVLYRIPEQRSVDVLMRSIGDPDVSVRAAVLDPEDRIMLVRFEFPTLTVWATPGGGQEAGEDDEATLRRELDEELGLHVAAPGPLIWTRTHVIPFLDGAWDGQRDHIYLVRSPYFTPEPALTWESYVAAEKTLAPGAGTGYGRRFVAREETRIGLVPVGYGDGFRRGLTGAEVLVEGERRRVLGAVSMDSFAVELGRSGIGAPVHLVGAGLLVEEHARRLRTINYEITCGIRSDPPRADRMVVDG